MAINLNPGADATLVTAATRASMANVPKDLSQMFQAQTENYRKTMESVGKSYSEVISTVAAVAAPFAKEAIQRQKMTNFGHSDVAASLDAEMSGAFTDIRERTKATYLLPKGERAIERKKIQRDRDKLFAQVKDMQGFILNTGDRVASGNFDQKSTPLQNQIFAQGIANAGQPLSSETKFKGFKSVSIEQDEVRGWQHQNAEGKLISSIDKYGNVILADKDNKAMFTPNADVGGLLKDKLDDKTKAFFQSIDLNALNGGVSLTGREVSIANQAGEAVTEKNIGGLLNEQWGNQPNSFMDDLHSESKLSVGMFNALKGVKGLKDVPGTAPGIDKADFASPENMEILNGAMTPGSPNYNFEEAKKAYTSWFAGNVINSSNLAENLKKKKEGLFPTIEKGKTLELNGIKIPKESLASYYNDIEAGNEFKIGDFTYTPKFGGWEKDDGVNGVVGTYENTADMLKNGLGPGGRHEGFKGIKQFEENTEGVFVNKELSGKINDLFGTDKTEESAVSNLNILFKDEPLLEGMFTEKNIMNNHTIGFNGKKYDVENGADAGALEKDINEYLKENKKEGTSAATEQGEATTKVEGSETQDRTIASASTTSLTPQSVGQTGDPLTKIDSVGTEQLATGITDPDNGTGMTGPAVIPEGTTSVQDQYTQQEVSSANPFNESVNKETGLPSKGSAASTHSEYKGRDVESGPTTTFEFSKSFVKAVGNDEKAIQRYIKKNPDVYPGVEIITDGVKGNDAFVIRVNGKEKTFQADPKMKVNYGTVGSNDQRRALEIHDWIKKNSGGKTTASEIKAPVNNTEPEVVEKVVEKNPVLNAAASESTSNTNPVDWLKNSGFIGANESQSDTTLVKTVNLVFDELLGETSKQSKLDLTHDDKAWCGALVYEVLTSTNAIPEFSGKKSSGPAYNFLRAKEYLKVGTEATEPKIGDIMVTSRSSGLLGTSTSYHVGFYGGKDKDGNILQLGGNQSNKLSYRTIPKGQKIEGYRRLDNMADVKEATVVEQKAKTKANEAPNLG
tara:strand:- start:185 stop:3244 length:3060 start_codon:yes stop_codon:yes gene_type:complete